MRPVTFKLKISDNVPIMEKTVLAEDENPIWKLEVGQVIDVAHHWWDGRAKVESFDWYNDDGGAWICNLKWMYVVNPMIHGSL